MNDIMQGDLLTTQPNAKGDKPKAIKPKGPSKAELKAKALALEIATAQAVTEAANNAAKAEAKAIKEAEAKAKAEAKAIKEAEAQAKAEADAKAKAEAEAKQAEVMKAETADAAKACEAISRKDADLLSSYMTLGKFQATVGPMFKSPVLFGQYVAKEIPDSASLDPALRSNCRWLYEALNKPDHDAANLLSLLQVNRIEDYKRSGNPTVIRRAWKEAMEKAALSANATKRGCTEEEAEAAEAAEATEAKAKAKTDLKALLAEYLEQLSHFKSKGDIVSDVGDVLTSFIDDGMKEGLAGLQRAVEAYRPKTEKAKAKAGTKIEPSQDDQDDQDDQDESDHDQDDE